MLEKLTEFHSAFTLRIKTSSGQNRPLENIDFGIRFKIELSKCLNKYAESSFNQAALTVQQTCANFLLSLVQECDKRLLPNQTVIKGLVDLNPGYVLSRDSRKQFSNLPMVNIIDENQLDVIEEQYRRIVLVDWQGHDSFKDKPLHECSTMEFWTSVFHTQDFKELSLYALSCLSLPSSNAFVERVFSQVTCMKTKSRNCLATATVDALLMIKFYLLSKSICCNKFIVPQSMITLYTSDIY